VISIKVKPKGELETKILTSTRDMVRQSAKVLSKRVTKWRENENMMIAYLPEKDEDAIRRTAREGGTPDYTTIQLPYSYAVAMAAHSYFTSVYLSRSPVFQFMGSTDEGEMQVLAQEALHQYQLMKARMRANLFIYFQDVPKYGEAWLMNYWREDEIRVSQIVEEEETYLGVIKTGRMVKRRKTQVIPEYSGNALQNIHPAKVYTDPRYPRNRFQDGDFVAVETTISVNQLLVGEDRGQYINVDKLKDRKLPIDGNGESVIEPPNAEILERPNVQDYTSQDSARAKDVWPVYEVYVNLIPNEWGLGSSRLPEKWVFTVDTMFTTVLECRPMGNFHNRYPLAMIEIEPEGYSHFSRSLLEVFNPIQTTLDWLVNSHFFNVRQVLNNQWLLDPSRVQERDLERKAPGKAIRLKPAAYGSDIRTALMQLPVQDVTQGHMRDMDMMYNLGERLGISDQVMGMSAPSSRRTAQEIRGDQTFGISRLKTMAEYFSATGVSDLSMMMLQNSQQFYDGEMRLRIVGQAAALAGDSFINVTPEMIAGQYMLEPVDGSLPIDRFAQANLWRSIIGEMAGVPQVIQQYDLGKVFGYVAQLAGVKNLERFKLQVQLMPDQAMQMAAQAGNAVPAVGNVMEPGQVEGMGTTG
jgi:hypothetical protein